MGRPANTQRPAYPFEPLERFICGNSDMTRGEIQTFLGLSGTTLKIWRTQGLREHDADRVACTRLGVHPSVIWPEQYARIPAWMRLTDPPPNDPPITDEERARLLELIDARNARRRARLLEWARRWADTHPLIQHDTLEAAA